MTTSATHTTGSEPAVLDWRGPGEIWTSETYNLQLRRKLTVAIDGLDIEIRSPKKQIRFPSSAIVEARCFRFPVPSMTLVFSHGEGHALITLFCFPRRARRQFTKQTGIVVTDQRTWRTGLEARRDQEKYALQGARPKSGLRAG